MRHGRSGSTLGGLPVARPVMNRCTDYSRGARLRHGGVGGANGNGRSTRRLELLAPTPLGADTAPPAGPSRRRQIELA
jgi:hypothetical protein